MSSMASDVVSWQSGSVQSTTVPFTYGASVCLGRVPPPRGSFRLRVYEALSRASNIVAMDRRWVGFKAVGL